MVAPAPYFDYGATLSKDNFVNWRARIEEILRHHHLPALGQTGPGSDDTDDERRSWRFSVFIAAGIVQARVLPSIRRQVPDAISLDHTKLVQALKRLTLFKFMDLPPEVRSRCYFWMLHDTTKMNVVLGDGETTRHPPITAVSSQVRSERMPLHFSHTRIFLHCTSGKVGVSGQARVQGQAGVAQVHSRTSVRQYALQWADSQDKVYLRHVRRLYICFDMITRTGKIAAEMVFLELDNEYGLRIKFMNGSHLHTSAEELLRAHIRGIEQTRKMFNLQGEALLMAVTDKRDVFRCNVLR